MFQDLARLFANPQRARILKYFVFQEDSKVSAAAAGKVVGVPKAAAEREARALARFGILSLKRERRGSVFTVNRAHPWLPSLSAFLDATTLPSDKALLDQFRGIHGITLIVATGSLAKEERSSLDLLIVAGRSKEKDIEQAIRRLESTAGMPIRYAILEPKRYTERLQARDRLLRDVFEFSHRVILGRI